MVLGSITQSLSALVSVLKENKLIAISLLILVLASSGTVVNFFAIGGDYECHFDNSTKTTTLYDTEQYNSCLGTYLQGQFFKFNYTADDCANHPYASNTEWLSACTSFITETQKSTFILDITLPFYNFIGGINNWWEDMFLGNNSNKTVNDWYDSLFESNICTRLYNCLEKDTALSMGLYDGCMIKKGFSDVDDFPSMEEFIQFTKINLDEVRKTEAFEKNNLFQVGCTGLGNEKRPTMKLFGIIPIFDWQFMAITIILYYIGYFLLWFAEQVHLGK